MKKHSGKLYVVCKIKLFNYTKSCERHVVKIRNIVNNTIN